METNIEIKGPQDVLLDLPQERLTSITRGRGPRRGNLEALLRYWRPIMRKPGGFRRCLVILANHPELYPLERICAWLHHETTGLWPNEGNHHKRGRKKKKKRKRRKLTRRVRRAARRKKSIDFGDDIVEVSAMRLAVREARDIGGVLVQPIAGRQNAVNLKTAMFVQYSEPLPVTGQIEVKRRGLIGSRGRAGQTVQGIGTFLLPGDMSDFRNPVRSQIYETLTPGGGRDRIPSARRLLRGAGRGARNKFRCPPGFQKGGTFTNREFSTCGAQILGLPSFGPGSPSEGAQRALARLARNAELVRSIGDLRKNRSAYDIIRAAQIPVAPKKASPTRRQTSVDLVLNRIKNEEFGTRLVRRDGVILEPVVSLQALGGMDEFDDMVDGSLIDRYTKGQIGKDLIPAFGAGLRDVYVGIPETDLAVKISRVGGELKPSEMDAVQRTFPTSLRRSANLPDPSAAIYNLSETTNGRFKVEIGELKNNRFNKVDDARNERIRVQSGGQVLMVPRWVYDTFLSRSAPRRAKGDKIFEIVNEEKAGNPFLISTKAAAHKAIKGNGRYHDKIELRIAAFADSIEAANVEVKKGGRVAGSAVSILTPGDRSPFTSPVRSGISRAITPGGGRGVGGRARAIFDPGINMHRCPPGTRNAGQFTDPMGRSCGYSLPRRLVNAIVDTGIRIEDRMEERRRRRGDREPVRQRLGKAYREKLANAQDRLSDVMKRLANVLRVTENRNRGDVGPTIADRRRRAGLTPEQRDLLDGGELRDALQNMQRVLEERDFDDADISDVRKAFKQVEEAAQLEAGRITDNPVRTPQQRSMMASIQETLEAIMRKLAQVIRPGDGRRDRDDRDRTPRRVRAQEAGERGLRRAADVVRPDGDRRGRRRGEPRRVRMQEAGERGLRRAANAVRPEEDRRRRQGQARRVVTPDGQDELARRNRRLGLRRRNAAVEMAPMRNLNQRNRRNVNREVQQQFNELSDFWARELGVGDRNAFSEAQIRRYIRRQPQRRRRLLERRYRDWNELNALLNANDENPEHNEFEDRLGRLAPHRRDAFLRRVGVNQPRRDERNNERPRGWTGFDGRSWFLDDNIKPDATPRPSQEVVRDAVSQMEEDERGDTIIPSPNMQEIAEVTESEPMRQSVADLEDFLAAAPSGNRRGPEARELSAAGIARANDRQVVQLVDVLAPNVMRDPDGTQDQLQELNERALYMLDARLEMMVANPNNAVTIPPFAREKVRAEISRRNLPPRKRLSPSDRDRLLQLEEEWRGKRPGVGLLAEVSDERLDVLIDTFQNGVDIRQRRDGVNPNPNGLSDEEWERVNSVRAALIVERNRRVARGLRPDDAREDSDDNMNLEPLGSDVVGLDPDAWLGDQRDLSPEEVELRQLVQNWMEDNNVASLWDREDTWKLEFVDSLSEDEANIFAAALARRQIRLDQGGVRSRIDDQLLNTFATRHRLNPEASEEIRQARYRKVHGIDRMNPRFFGNNDANDFTQKQAAERYRDHLIRQGDWSADGDIIDRVTGENVNWVRDDILRDQQAVNNNVQAVNNAVANSPSSPASAARAIANYDWKEKRRQKIKKRQEQAIQQAIDRHGNKRPYAQSVEDISNMRKPDGTPDTRKQNAYFRQIFSHREEVDAGTVEINGQTYRKTITPMVTSTKVRRSADGTVTGASVRGKFRFRVYDSDGNVVADETASPQGGYSRGLFSRNIRITEGKVSHSTFGVDRTLTVDGKSVNFKAGGFGDKFNNNAILFYRGLGVDKISVGAAGDGNAIWPRQGFREDNFKVERLNARGGPMESLVGKFRSYERKIASGETPDASEISARILIGDSAAASRVEAMLASAQATQNIDDMPSIHDYSLALDPSADSGISRNTALHNVWRRASLDKEMSPSDRQAIVAALQAEGISDSKIESALRGGTREYKPAFGGGDLPGFGSGVWTISDVDVPSESEIQDRVARGNPSDYLAQIAPPVDEINPGLGGAQQVKSGYVPSLTPPGHVRANGPAVIPDGANGLTTQTRANTHVRNGGSLAEVPDSMLLKAIKNNSDKIQGGQVVEEKRFKKIGRGNGGGVNGIIIYEDRTTGTLYGVKFSGSKSYFKNEAENEVISGMIAEQLGFGQGDFRFAGPVATAQQNNDRQMYGATSPILFELGNALRGPVVTHAGRNSNPSRHPTLPDINSDDGIADGVRLLALDMVITNSDRHGSNFMWGGTPSETAVLYPIDNGAGLQNISSRSAWDPNLTDRQNFMRALMGWNRVARSEQGILLDPNKQNPERNKVRVTSRLKELYEGPPADKARAIAIVQGIIDNAKTQRQGAAPITEVVENTRQGMVQRGGGTASAIRRADAWAVTAETALRRLDYIANTTSAEDLLRDILKATQGGGIPSMDWVPGGTI